MFALSAIREDDPSRPGSSLVVGRVVVPGALLVLYGVVQLLYFRPPRSITYFELARAFPNVDPDHHSLRVGLLLPVRGMQLVFGYSEAAYYAVPLLAAALLVLATYSLGRMLFDPVVGAAAAVLLIFNHVFLSGSSILLPDVLGTALFTAALAILVAVAQRHEHAEVTWERRDHSLLVLAGVLLGWSYLVREFVVFVFPVIPFVFWSYRLPWRKLVWLAGAAAAVFAAELVLNGILYDSPFERFSVAAGHGGQRDYITDTRWDALVRLPVRLANDFGAVPSLVLLALFPGTLVIRQRSFRIVALWFLSFWLLITLGTGLIVPSFRFVIADMLRYWTPLIPALVIGGVAVADRAAIGVWRWWTGRSRGPISVPAVGVMVFAVLLGVLGSADDRASHIYKANGATQLDHVRTWLERHGSGVSEIWTDPFTAHVLPLYERTTFGDRVWEGTVRDFERRGRFIDLHDVDDGVIVLYGPGYRQFTRRLSDGRFVVPGARSAIRQFERDPGPQAEVVLRRRDLTVYRINA